MNDHLGNVRAVSGALGEAGQTYNDINSGVSGYIGSGSETTLPAAYLQYIVFDANRNPTGQQGFFRVTTASNMAKAKVTMPQITIEQPGFIYIFVYNRSNSSNWVFFDEMVVNHEHSSIVAGADYYPFGLAMNGREITDEPYRWGYQGQYAQENDSTGWNEFQLRMYDARFGRWLSPDPYGQFASPYLAMGNMPHMGTDPDGGLFGLGPVASGAMIGAAVGTVAGLAFDPEHWYLWAAGGAGLGAIGGAIYNASTYDLTGIGRVGKNPKYSGSPTITAGKSVGNFAANYGNDILLGGVRLLQHEHNEQFYYDAIDGMILNNGNSLGRHDVSLTFNKTSGNATYLGFNNGKHHVNFDISDYEVTVENIRAVTVHEVYGHGIMKYGDKTKDHYKAYWASIDSRYWSATTKQFKVHVAQAMWQTWTRVGKYGGMPQKYMNVIYQYHPAYKEK